MIVLGDPPEAWERLGFVVQDGVVALDHEQLVLTGEGGGILEVRAPGARAADGLPLGPDDAAPRAAAAHPNGATVAIPRASGGSWSSCPTPALCPAPARSGTRFSPGGASRPSRGSAPSSRS